MGVLGHSSPLPGCCEAWPATQVKVTGTPHLDHQQGGKGGREPAAGPRARPGPGVLAHPGLALTAHSLTNPGGDSRAEWGSQSHCGQRVSLLTVPREPSGC